ncbi:polyprenyl synthetase family protein [Nocardiopsis alba]|uniref:polyprenyl synthetase family protein n=1 Tax=Nocardiopsis alba TaxID=53437 RepID=UPI00366ECEC2
MTGRALLTGVEDIREAVGETLHGYLAERAREVGALDAECDRELADRVASFALGGKRIRSTLVWWGRLAGGGEEEGPGARIALSAGAAIELFQAFALIHDDVMDSAPERRGEPSLHVLHTARHRSRSYAGDPERYGDSMAVLTGDLALAWADDLLYEVSAGRPRALRIWRDMRTEVMVGQYLDLRSHARTERSVGRALRIDRLKTASYTVERPLQLGAALAGAPAPVEEALRGYGRDVGVAYQLRDDLLDLYGDTARTGREPGEDLREGKNTMLLASGIDLARRSGDTAALALLEGVGTVPVDPAEVAETLERLGARDLVGGHCRSLADRGASRITGLDIDPGVRDGLLDFAESAARI